VQKGGLHFKKKKNQQLIIDAQNPSECRTHDFLKKEGKPIMLLPYRAKLAQTGIYFYKKIVKY
jgi:hypothetical protein